MGRGLMAKWVGALGLLLAVFLGPGAAWAAPLQLEAGGQTYLLPPHLELLEDSQGSLTLEQVMALGEGAFVPNPGGDPNYGFTGKHIWVRFTLRNTTPQTRWILRQGNPTIDRFQVAVVTPDGRKVFQQEAGDILPFNIRPFNTPQFHFALDIPQGESRTVYLHFMPGYVVADLSLLSPSAFKIKTENERVLFGIYFGSLGVMFFYNLFLFFSIRDKSYLFYILFILSSLMLASTLKGLSFQYLWPDHPMVGNYMMATFINFAAFTFGLFSRQFLDLPKNFPKADRWVLMGLAVAAVLGLFSPLADISAAVSLSIVMATITMSGLLGCGVVVYRRGVLPARFFLISMSMYMVGMMSEGMRGMGLAPNNLFTTNGVMVGSMLEVILLSFALADRFNTMKQEKDQVAAELVGSLRRENEMRERYNQQLEQEVADRTQELAEALDELAVLNRTKDRFFSIIAHDLRNPFSTLINISRTMHENSELFEREEMVEFAGRMYNTSEQGYRLLENLLQWARLQMGGIKPQPENFDLRQGLADEVELLKSMAREKHIELQNDLPAGVEVMGDKNMVCTVVRNLVSNAIKFSPPGKNILLALEQAGGMAVLRVVDQGVGIEEKSQEMLFDLAGRSTPGTNNEPGTGLGLILCREMAELNGGTLKVESTQGKGTTVVFSLPLSKEGFSSESLAAERGDSAN